MAESEDYNAENEDYKRRGGETEITGDDVAGDEGLLEIEIPAARYGDGKVATAQDSDLIAGNIKKDVVIFGVTGTIEPATLTAGTFYPAVDKDDGYWYLTYFYNDTESYLALGNNWNGGCKTYVRFPNVTIPQGSDILCARLTFTAQIGHDDDIEIKIAGNDIDDAIAPTNATTGNALTLTTAEKEWNITEDWVLNSQYESPDIKAVIQEIVDREGFESGNAILLLISDNGSKTGNDQQAWPVDYDEGSKKPELYIIWE